MMTYKAFAFFWPCGQVLAEFRRRWPEQGAELSEQNIRTAGHQVGFLGVQQVLRRQVAEGEAHYQEPVVLEALLKMADASAQAQAAEALPVRSLPEQLESVSPSGAKQEPVAAPADASSARAQWQSPKAMGRHTQGAVSEPLKAHRAPPSRHAPSRGTG